MHPKKNRILSSLVVLSLGWATLARGGEPVAYDKTIVAPPTPAGFSDSRRPISNPTLFDLAIPQTQIHPFFAYHRLPSSIDTIVGGVPVGGHVEAYAVQLEIKLTDRLSLNAVKDGYIRFRPDSTLSNTEGWGNVAAGLKYAFILDPVAQFAAAVQLIYEIPMGSQDVFQGTGDGTFIPSLNLLKLAGKWQFANQLGFEIPVNGDTDSSSFYNSFGVSYALTDWFFPTFEVNWFAVLNDGDGGQRFNNQVGGAVPALATFEASDLFNFGASNADQNRHLVTFALGARARVCSAADLGFGWEFPVTSDEKSVIKDRFYVDVVLRF